MCRVHSLVLWILVAFEVASLMLALGEGGSFTVQATWRLVGPGSPGSPGSPGRSDMGCTVPVAMLIIMAGAYFLDEQTRLQSFGQVMSLQDQNAALAEMMLRWKALDCPAMRIDVSGDVRRCQDHLDVGDHMNIYRFGYVRRISQDLGILISYKLCILCFG
eukprot:Skav212643  [mRNA]  locus=scaffold681:60750:62035:+ [translate_table: standard]